MATRNFPQQGVVITPEPDPIFSGLSFNSDKSNTSGRLAIVDLPPTHGRGGTQVNQEPNLDNALLSEDGLYALMSEDGTYLLIPEETDITDALLTDDGMNYMITEDEQNYITI